MGVSAVMARMGLPALAVLLACLLVSSAPGQTPLDVPSVSPPQASPDLVHFDSSTGQFQAPPPRPELPYSPPPGSELFCRDRIDVQFMSGVQFAPSHLGPSTPTFDFLTEQIRLGRILTNPFFDCTIFRGDFEGIIELTTAPVVDGFGSIVIGPSAVLRYNFVQPDAIFIPYIQAGAGAVYNDAFRDQTQRAIGQSLEFYLEAGVGVRCRLGENWSLDFEAEFSHISNARLAQRNYGINGAGASIGLTYFFK